MIGCYIAKTLSKRKLCAVCKVKMIADERSIKYDEYFKNIVP